MRANMSSMDAGLQAMVLLFMGSLILLLEFTSFGEGRARTRSGLAMMYVAGLFLGLLQPTGSWPNRGGNKGNWSWMHL